MPGQTFTADHRPPPPLPRSSSDTRDQVQVQLPQQQQQQQQQHRQHPRDNGATPLNTTTLPVGRPRTATADTAEIDETLSHPGSVRINVKGAFIVDQDSATPTTPDGRSGSPARHGTKDIRLPNHTAVVSHIAIDVRGGVFSVVVVFVVAAMMSSCFFPLPLRAELTILFPPPACRLVARSPSSSGSRAKPTRPSPAVASTFSASRRSTLTSASSTCAD